MGYIKIPFFRLQDELPVDPKVLESDVLDPSAGNRIFGSIPDLVNRCRAENLLEILLLLLRLTLICLSMRNLKSLTNGTLFNNEKTAYLKNDKLNKFQRKASKQGESASAVLWRRSAVHSGEI